MPVLAAALASAPASSSQPEPLRIPTKAEIERCPKLAGIDWKRVRRQLAKAKPSAAPVADEYAEHRRIRGPRPLPDLSRAEIVLDVAIGAGETQEIPTSTSSFVWKEPGGTWQLNRVDYTFYPPSPLPPGSGVVMDAEWHALEQRPLTEGPLARDRALALDAILADPCFAAQPDIVPWGLPLKKGGEDRCHGLINSTLRLRTPKRVRYLSDPCGRGYGYQASGLVMYATLDASTWVERALAKALGRADLEIADLRRGLSGTVAELHCGSVSAPGMPATRFTWSRYMRGPYAQDELILEKDVAAGEFEEDWQKRCAALAPK